MLPEYGRGRSQFQHTTCFVFIPASRLWHSQFFHPVVSTTHLALVCMACTLPWWDGAGGGVHLLILLVDVSPITAAAASFYQLGAVTATVPEWLEWREWINCCDLPGVDLTFDFTFGLDGLFVVQAALRVDPQFVISKGDSVAWCRATYPISKVLMCKYSTPYGVSRWQSVWIILTVTCEMPDG